METIKRIGGLVRPYRRKIVLGLTLQLVVILTRLIAPYVTKTLINDVITQMHTELLFPLCGALLGLALIRGACIYTRGLTMERLSQNAIWDLRTGLYAHLEELPYQFYDKHRVGEIMSRMTGDIEGLRSLFANGVITVFDNAVGFVGALIFMLSMSWQITLIILVLTPVIAVLAWAFRKRIRLIFRDIREQNAVLNTRTQENLAGMHVVKAFAQEPHEEEQFERENRKLLDLNLKATWVWSNFVPVLDFLGALCTPLSLLGGAILIANGQMDIGTMVGVTGYIGMLVNPMRALSNIINMLTQAVTSAEKLFYYVDFGAAIREPENAMQPKEYQGHVVFDHVTFSYGDHPVLKDITFEAKPGQTIAVMGATGSGKSTLITLLGRFYDIQEGSIKIDGIDVREHSLKPLRRQIGYVMQETFLFSDTIADNIRFGRPDAQMDQVERSAKVAQAKEFIDHMPGGYETVVGERGLGLSGGQKQRVAIARAVLVDPKILVLDDSTSAVDMETEYQIQQELKEVLKNRTTFVIAHRISSVKNADLILVLDHGEIAERGNHKELMAQGGIYYQMVMDQMASAVKV
ncbi:MAG: ABC transporter ATP-binding protein [Clostridiales bacterium]|nr:ABC transporter ATP-binding protein [Clostridiales bacterium]